MKAPRTAKEAKKLYKQGRRGAYQEKPGCVMFWKITMLGWAKWTLKGNQKRILHKGWQYWGRNTKFKGEFQMIPTIDYYKLDYDQPENSWWVRQVKDRVRFVSPTMGIGRFYWSRAFCCWFTMELIEEGE